MAVAAEVNRAVPAAGEALGELERWGRGWSPAGGQLPVIPRAPAAWPGVGVLGRQGTHFFGTLDDLFGVHLGRLGAPGPGGEPGFQAGPGSAVMSGDCR